MIFFVYSLFNNNFGLPIYTNLQSIIYNLFYIINDWRNCLIDFFMKKEREN